MKAPSPSGFSGVPPGPLRTGASGYVDGSTPHRPRQVLDWSAWREAKGPPVDKTRYTVNPVAPVILRRVDDRKAYPAIYNEGSPKIAIHVTEKAPESGEDEKNHRSLGLRLAGARSPKEDPPFLPGTVQTIRTPVGSTSTSAITGVWSSTPRSMDANQLAVQAVQAVQALQAKAHSVQLPIQGRGTSPWTPSNVKAALGSPEKEASRPVEVEAEKPRDPRAEETAPVPLSRPKPVPVRQLAVPGAEEALDRQKSSRSNSVTGTPEAPRKISIQRKVSEPGQSLRPDSPKRKGAVPVPAAPAPMPLRRESAPGGGGYYYGSKLDEPYSPSGWSRDARGGSTRRSRPETGSDGGRSPMSARAKAAAGGRVASSGRFERERPERAEPENASPGRRRGVPLKCSFEDPGGTKASLGTSMSSTGSRARSTSRRARSASRDPSRARSPTLQERTATAMQALEHGMEPPGASDKWRVAQLFAEAVPKSHAKVLKIERLVTPEMFSAFLKRTDGGENACNCGIAFYVPQEEEVRSAARLLGSDAAVALKPLMDAMRPEQSPQAVSLVVVFLSPPLAQRHLGHRDGGDRPGGAEGAFQVGDVGQLLPAYVVHIQLYGDSDNDEGRMGSPSPERARSMSRQRKVSLTNPLIQETLLRLPSLREDSAGTVLLSSNSQEAEAVVSLYLQCGGAARLRRPPGVDLREALGGVVVQRFENKHLAQQYLAIEVDAERGGPRFKEDVVWHGTRLKRSDGDATLAHKLQSIAEHGFDPSRCIKGAHAEGGIWVASCPMESFGVGGDGLVAFIICLAKTTFNEWVDTSCARVLQRERVLPLYSLVHV